MLATKRCRECPTEPALCQRWRCRWPRRLARTNDDTSSASGARYGSVFSDHILRVVDSTDTASVFPSRLASPRPVMSASVRTSTKIRFVRPAKRMCGITSVTRMFRAGQLGQVRRNFHRASPHQSAPSRRHATMLAASPRPVESASSPQIEHNAQSRRSWQCERPSASIAGWCETTASYGSGSVMTSCIRKFGTTASRLQRLR